MNATNRGVNRIILFLVGLVLIGAGGAAALAAVWPAAGDTWKTVASNGIDAMVNADNASRLSDGSAVSWFVLAILAASLLIVVVAVIVIARLGGGRSTVVLRDEAREGIEGSVTIRQAFASDAITGSLGAHDEILSSRVTMRRLRAGDVLQVSVTPRQNVCPVEVAETVSEIVDHLATLLGRPTPTVVTIHSSLRSRLADNQPRVN